ncbi:conserved protein of unknown function [Burkholderia multivorans]
MKEHPILFSAPMVRAILDGRKTQTRRIVKWRDVRTGLNLRFSGLTASAVGNAWVLESPTRASHEWRCAPTQCPHGHIGDRLWVRETWAQPTTLDPGPTFYRANYPYCVPQGFENVPAESEITWKPSIHMPRAMARITLEITGVRVERLQSISEDDAIAEGVDGQMCAAAVGRAPSRAKLLPVAVHGYAHLWESLNAARGHGWDANPWVWVIEFRRITP